MRRLVAGLALAFSVACGGGAGAPAPGAPSAPAQTPPSQSAAEGAWTLRTVDGAALPYTLPDTSHGKIELAGIALLIQSPSSSTYGLYTQTMTRRDTNNGRQFTSIDEGSWTLTGTRIQLTNGITFSSSGYINENTMTLKTSDLRTYVYVK